MKNNNLVIGGLVLVVLAIMAMFFLNSPTRYNWNENYRISGVQPYSTTFLRQLLDGYYKDYSIQNLKGRIRDKLSVDNGGVYFFVNKMLYLNNDDIDTLLAFVRNGGEAFFACRDIPVELFDNLYYDDCDSIYWDGYYYIEDTLATMNFVHPSLQDANGYDFTFPKVKNNRRYRWNFIDSVYMCQFATHPMVELGNIKINNWTYPNFVRQDYGEGRFYFHTDPMAFTNYHVSKDYGLAYVEKVLGHLEPGNIYWDNVSNAPNLGEERRQERSHSSDFVAEESPLSYILGEPSLRWAWYLALASGILFLLFRAKRRQRIIPITETNTNTSLEFIQTIGQLYYQQNDHKQLALQKVHLFLAFIRDHYGLSTHELDEKFEHRLAVRSEIPHAEIERLMADFRSIKHKVSIGEKDLIDFHVRLDLFYNNCK